MGIIHSGEGDLLFAGLAFGVGINQLQFFFFDDPCFFIAGDLSCFPQAPPRPLRGLSQNAVPVGDRGV